jgi:hypothetical protein
MERSNAFSEAASAICDAASRKEIDAMSRRHLAALAIALAAISEPAAAELRGTPEGPPLFTAAEVAVIARNTLLTNVVQEHPWIVRRLLDALAAVEAGGAATSSTPGTDSARGKEGHSPGQAPSIDPKANPDLGQLERSSPEAVLDLFEILKKAQAAKPSKPK